MTDLFERKIRWGLPARYADLILAIRDGYRADEKQPKAGPGTLRADAALEDLRRSLEDEDRSCCKPSGVGAVGHSAVSGSAASSSGEPERAPAPEPATSGASGRLPRPGASDVTSGSGVGERAVSSSASFSGELERPAPDHFCYCVRCARDVFPLFWERLGPHHHGVKFGDSADTIERVLLGGREVRYTVETIDGDPGVAILLGTDDEGYLHTCRTCGAKDEFCRQIYWGEVRTVLRGAA